MFKNYSCQENENNKITQQNNDMHQVETLKNLICKHAVVTDMVNKLRP